MNKTVCAFVAASVLLVSAPTASAMSTTEALVRMDAIIAEMQKLRAEFAKLASAPQQPQPTGSVAGVATKAVLTDDLSYGATNASIERIQKLLATDVEIYADGTISGFFGPKTQDAIRRFQARFGLDPVGVVGPSTKAVLEAFMAKYPDQKYPAGVLNGPVPQIAGASTGSPAPTPVPANPAPVVGTNPFSTIRAVGDGEDYDITVVYADGSPQKTFVAAVRSEDDVVPVVAKRLGVAASLVKAVISIRTSEGSSRSDDEEEEAEELIDEVKDALGELKDDIEAAEEDGDDVDDAADLYDEARDAYREARDYFDEEEYEDAIDAAKEALDLIEEAEDEL